MALIFRDRPISSILCVGFAAFGELCQVLAFLLPLKVILIAGSDRIPSFLRPIIDESQRDFAIFALAAAAVGCFGAARLIDNVITKVAKRNATRIVEVSNSRSVAAMRQQEAADHYQNFVEIASGLLFTSVMLLGLGLINPILTVSTVAAALAIFLAFAAIQARRPVGMDRIGKDTVSAVVQIGSTILFFVGFLAILTQIWASEGNGGQLSALIGFVVLRRLLSAGATAIKDSFKVTAARPLIDVLFSPHHRFVAPAERGDHERNTAFERLRRTQRASLALAPVVGEIATATSIWRDTSARPYQAFTITVRFEGAGETEREFVERLFNEKDRHWLDHEQFLFQHIRQETIGAPVPLVTTSDSGFVSDISEIRALTAPRRELDEILTKCLTNHWKITPPADLLQSYGTSTRTLSERLTSEFVQSLQIAADCAEEQALFDELVEKREAITDQLARMPLYIHNPDIGARSLFKDLDERAVVLDWGRWSIEPIGFVLPNAIEAESLDEMLRQTAEMRSDISPEVLSTEAVQFVQSCVRFETAANRREYKHAFVHLEAILAFFASSESDAEICTDDGRVSPAAGSR